MRQRVVTGDSYIFYFGIRIPALSIPHDTTQSKKYYLSGKCCTLGGAIESHSSIKKQFIQTGENPAVECLSVPGAVTRYWYRWTFTSSPAAPIPTVWTWTLQPWKPRFKSKSVSFYLPVFLHSEE